MKKLLIGLLGSASLLNVSAQAAMVHSESKYPIIVHVFQGSSTCKAQVSPTIFAKAIQAYNQLINKKKKEEGKGFSNFIQKGSKSIANNLSEGLNLALEGTGCHLIQDIYLGEYLIQGTPMNVPEGTIILAFKDPIYALSQGAVVNPLPAVCEVKKGQQTIISTKKSNTLQSLIGIKGDGGLKCDYHAEVSKKGAVQNIKRVGNAVKGLFGK